MPISVGYQSGSHYSTIQALEQYLPPSDIKLSFADGILFSRLEKLIDREVPAASLFSGPYYFLEQLGFRKIIDTTFMMATMLTGDPDPEDVRKYFRALRVAQRDIDLRPELYTHYYRNEFPKRFLSQVDTRRWGPGERIVFEPYTKEVFERLVQLDPRAQHLRRAGHGQAAATKTRASRSPESAVPSSRLLRKLFSTAYADEIFDDGARLQGMLDFEAALARAEARIGLVPADAAEGIARKCRAALFDLERLADAAALAGNPAIPMVKALTALVAAENAEAARYVHLGATSQDAMDTGLVLQLRRLSAGLSPRPWPPLRRSRPACGGTPGDGPCRPDVAAAGASGHLRPQGRRLARRRRAARRKACGPGAADAASSSSAAHRARSRRWADGASRSPRRSRSELIWPCPPCPGTRIATGWPSSPPSLGMLAGTLGKIGRDVSLLMQTEVGEAFEPAGEGRGGSSTMPHKRNPVAAPSPLAAAARAPGLVATLLSAMPQEHERGLGGWQAEWETLPELAALVAGSLAALRRGGGRARDRRRADARQPRGAGRDQLAEAASSRPGATHRPPAGARDGRAREPRALLETRRTLLETLAADPAVTAQLSPAELAAALDPRAYLGNGSCFRRPGSCGAREGGSMPSDGGASSIGSTGRKRARCWCSPTRSARRWRCGSRRCRR